MARSLPEIYIQIWSLSALLGCLLSLDKFQHRHDRVFILFITASEFGIFAKEDVLLNVILECITF